MKNPIPTIPLVSLTVLVLSVGGGQPRSQQGPQETSPALNNQNIRIDIDYGKMPLYFIPNQGQMDKQVAYYVQGKDKTIYFTPGGITFALTKPSPKEIVHRGLYARPITGPASRTKSKAAGGRSQRREARARARCERRTWAQSSGRRI